MAFLLPAAAAAGSAAAGTAATTAAMAGTAAAAAATTGSLTGLAASTIAASAGTAAAAGSTWLTTAGLIASGVGTGISALGAMRQGQAGAAASKFNANVNENNAAIAKQNMDYAGQTGNEQLARQQLENRARIGAIKAGQGASGVDINSPSFTDVRSSARETGQLSAIDIRNAATRKAYGYNTDAINYDAQAGLDRSRASYESSAGATNAAATLLGGAYDATTGYKKYLAAKGTA